MQPTLFYPKSYATAREFVEENLEMQKGGTFLPFATIHKATGRDGKLRDDAYYSIYKTATV